MSANFDDGGPAYPQNAEWGTATPVPEGMTLLDWFAGRAMQGILSNPTWNGINLAFDDDVHGTAARTAYTYARAMVAEKRRLEGQDDKSN